MLLMVAGTAVTTLASFMLTAAIAIRAHTVMRLRAGESEARVAPSVIFRFIFRMPPNVGRKCGRTPAIIGEACEPHAMGRLRLGKDHVCRAIRVGMHVRVSVRGSQLAPL